MTETQQAAGRPVLPSDIELAGIVRRFHTARVLVIGDIILDRYVTGTVSRLSPEAPIPVLRPSGKDRPTLGGAANVALNIATLGGQAMLVGVIGEDAAGQQIETLVSTTLGIASALVRAPDRPTTAKTRFMTGSHQLLRLDEETTAPLDPATVDAVLAAVRRHLADADVIILSDYAKGVLCDGVLDAILALDRTGKTLIADPKRPEFAAYRGADILTPNELEVRTATRIDAEHDSEADRAGRVALEQTMGQAVLVTRSAKGLTLVRRDREALHLPTRAREVADVSGAGDTLVAALAVALGAGASLPDAAVLANATAGISVAKQGTATVTAQELLDVLHLDDLVQTDRKVAGREDAAIQVAEWKRRGLTVGFANGCFDLIHPGHVRLLSDARAACDKLVVALNTDASVKRLKGPSRPLQNEMARATVMASMAPVDLVTLFDEDTPLELIELLQPDVLVKGSDYTVEQVVGADRVQSWGGRVVLVTLREGHSTTGTIRRMTAPAA